MKDNPSPALQDAPCGEPTPDPSLPCEGLATQVPGWWHGGAVTEGL